MPAPAQNGPDGADLAREEAVANWIKDGTSSEEPVTVETPEAEGTPEAQAQEPTPKEEPQETPPAEEPAEEPERKMFKGRLGEEEYEIPADFLVPSKRKGEVEWVPITQAVEERMMRADYSRKTSEHSQNVKAHEASLREFERNQAKLDAREKALKANEQRLAEARNNPEKMEAYLQHMEMYQNNPEYREAVDKGMKADELQVELDSLKEVSEEQAAAEAAQIAQGWIDDLTSEERFSTVDPERVRKIYSNALIYQGVEFDKSVVEQICEQEVGEHQRILSRSPLRKELDELKAKIAEREARESADAHNASTQHKITRSKAPNVAPTGSGAGAEPPRGPYGLQDRDAVRKRWISGS